MKSVLREIRKLEWMGILRGWKAGRFRFYLLDRDHLAHDGLRVLFAATRERRRFRFRDPARRAWEDWYGGGNAEEPPAGKGRRPEEKGRRPGGARRPVKNDPAGRVRPSHP